MNAIVSDISHLLPADWAAAHDETVSGMTSLASGIVDAPLPPRKLHIDYETRGVPDLNQCGVFPYAEHPHTSALVLAWAIDDEPFDCWNILRGHPMPARLRAVLLNPDVQICAHNANFEWVISMVVGRRQGFLDEECLAAMMPLMRWSCTAARACSCGLPRALEKVAQALQLEHQKDMAGHKLMLEMCKPYAFDMDMNPLWLEDAGRMERLRQYAMSDGYAEREVDDYLPELSEFEQEVWACTERMNSRGVEVDKVLLQKLSVAVGDAVASLNNKINRLTNGQVEKVSQPKRIVAWLKNYDIDTEDDKIGKWIIAGLLEDPAIPAIVREVLVTRRDGGKSSTSKFNTMMKRLNLDGRIRGALLYAGAAATARWSSRGVQLQNLPRGKIVKDVLAAIEAILTGMPLAEIETTFGPPMVVFSELVRPILIAAPKCWMARGDYSQIEARVLPWLSGEEVKTRAFMAYDRGEGPDIYIVTAAEMYRVLTSSIDKDDPRRQSGKVTDLACGFGGGKGALHAMAKIYGMKLTDEQAQTFVDLWREANPNTKQFWYDLENAAVRCMQSAPGQVFRVGRTGLISFKRNNQCLAMILPSGHRIIYWYARLEEVDTPWGTRKWAVTYYGEDSQKHIWRRFTAWYGIFCENAVQAIARDIMAYSLVMLERRNMRPVLTVHDEAVCELRKRDYPTAWLAAKSVLDVMLERPSWAPGLPIAAEASADVRYTKGSKENTISGYTKDLF